MSWTASELRWVLEHWPELALGTRPKMPERPAGTKRVKSHWPPYAFRAAERVADLERALAALRAEDGRLADLVVTTYLMPATADVSKPVRLVLWSAERGVHVRDALRLLEQAERRLLEILNGGGGAHP